MFTKRDFQKDEEYLRSEIRFKLRNSNFSLASLKTEVPSCYYENDDVETLAKVAMRTPFFRYVTADAKKLLEDPLLRRANEPDGIPVLYMIAAKGSVALSRFMACFGLDAFVGNEHEAYDLLDRLICTQGVFVDIPKDPFTVQENPTESLPREHEFIYALGYRHEHVRYISSLDSEGLLELLDGLCPLGEIDLTNLRYMALTGKSLLPHFLSQRERSKLAHVTPLKVFMMAGPSQYFVSHQIPSNFDAFNIDSVQFRHCVGDYPPTATALLRLLKKEIHPGVDDAVIAIIRALTFGNADEIATRYGIICPDWTGENKYYRKMEFIIGELVDYYPRILARTSGTLKGSRHRSLTFEEFSIITQDYTIRELRQFTGIPYRLFRDRKRLLEIYQALRAEPYRWSRMSIECANEESFHAYGGTRGDTYKDEDYKHGVFSYGNQLLRNCYDVWELADAFTDSEGDERRALEEKQKQQRGELEYLQERLLTGGLERLLVARAEGKVRELKDLIVLTDKEILDLAGDSFKFVNPMYVKSQENIDPLTGTLVSPTFSDEEVLALQKFLQNELSNGVLETNLRNEYEKLLQKIGVGIAYNKSMMNEIAELRNYYAGLNPEEMNLLLEYFVWTFILGMYLRFWKGPGHPYPGIYDEAKAVDRDPVLKDVNVLIHYRMFDLLRVQIATRPSLQGVIKRLKLYDYDFNTKKISYYEKTIEEVHEQNVNGVFCGAHLSELFVKTSFVLLTYVAGFFSFPLFNSNVASKMLVMAGSFMDLLLEIRDDRDTIAGYDALLIAPNPKDTVLTPDEIREREEKARKETLALIDGLRETYQNFITNQGQQPPFDGKLSWSAGRHINPEWRNAGVVAKT